MLSSFANFLDGSIVCVAKKDYLLHWTSWRHSSSLHKKLRSISIAMLLEVIHLDDLEMRSGWVHPGLRVLLKSCTLKTCDRQLGHPSNITFQHIYWVICAGSSSFITSSRRLLQLLVNGYLFDSEGAINFAAT
jgi:hypothetical protein